MWYVIAFLPSQCSRGAIDPWRWYSSRRGMMRPPDFRPVRPPPAVVVCSSCCLYRAPLPQRFKITLPIFGAVQQPGWEPCVRKVAQRIQYSRGGYVTDKHRDCQNQGLMRNCGWRNRCAIKTGSLGLFLHYIQWYVIKLGQINPKCHRKTHCTGNVEAIKLVSDAVTALTVQ
jgi:hypothetical protein